MSIVTGIEAQKVFQSRLSGWKSETEFVDFIDANAPRIAEELIGCPYESHKREWYLSGLKALEPIRHG